MLISSSQNRDPLEELNETPRKMKNLHLQRFTLFEDQISFVPGIRITVNVKSLKNMTELFEKHIQPEFNNTDLTVIVSEDKTSSKITDLKKLDELGENFVVMSAQDFKKYFKSK